MLPARWIAVDKPALLGGAPLFSTRLGIVSPCLPSLDAVKEPVREMLESGNLTNDSHNVRRFEQALSERLGVRNAIAVANGTLGLILALESLKLKGEIILPSFTYSATAHAVYWARLEPVFVDILPDTFTLDPEAVENAIGPRTVAILPVHVFGHPCEMDELEQIAERHQLALLFDAAHAMGSCYKNKPIGQFGDVEVFSFHATKMLPVGEGGCITTSRSDLAHYLRLARKFGESGNEDTHFPGLNAKMQEFNAIVGLVGLLSLDEHIANRHGYADSLKHRLCGVPGLSFQCVRPFVFTNYQNLAILVDEKEFGLSRDELAAALAAENVVARKYFYPPVHLHNAYRGYHSISLPVTERVSRQVLCLPLYSEMTESMLDGICAAIGRICEHAPAVRHVLDGTFRDSSTDLVS